MQDIINFLLKNFGYHILWLPALFLVIVVILFRWYYLKKHPKSFDSEFSRAFTENSPDLEDRLANMELRLEKILSQTTEIKDRIAWIEGQVNVLLNKREDTAEVKTFEEQVYKAYDSGKKVTDLAREFGRDKGEIELILNLRRLKKD